MSPSTLQIIAVTIFTLAIIHIFSVKYFEHLAHRSEKHSGLFHLLGEIEVVFGIWAMILVLFMFIFLGKEETMDYVNNRNYVIEVDSKHILFDHSRKSRLVSLRFSLINFTLA